MSKTKEDFSSMELYYFYLGNVSWLKGEFLKKRYDSLKYLLPVEKDDKYNFIVEINFPKDEESLKFINMYYFKNFGLFKVKTEILKRVQFSNEDFLNLFKFLKETHLKKF